MNTNTANTSTSPRPPGAYPPLPSHYIPPTPISGPSAQAPPDFFGGTHANLTPGHVQQQVNGAPPTFDADAPPSYSDAMDENSGSVDVVSRGRIDGMEPGSRRVEEELEMGGAARVAAGRMGDGVPADFTGQ